MMLLVEGLRSSVQYRSGLTLSADGRESALPDNDWHVVTPVDRKHPDAPSWPTRLWIKDTKKLEMRQAVSSARDLRGYQLEVVMFDDDRDKLLREHLAQRRAEMARQGPAMRVFLAKRLPQDEPH